MPRRVAEHHRMQPDTRAGAPDDAQADVSPRILVLFGSGVIFGAERGNLEALIALKAQGAEILCLIRDETWSHIVPPALDARGIAWRKVPYVEQWRRSRAHVILLRGPWAWLTANLRFLKAVREFKPTHIHAYGQLFVANFMPGLWLTKTPLVYRAGDEPTLHNAFWRATWHFVVGRTSRFVAISKFIKNSLTEAGVPSDNIEVIYNVPPTRFESSPGLELSILPAEGRVVTFLGQVSEHKGPHLLLQAFRQIAPLYPDARVAIAGRISEWEGDAWARSLRDTTQNDPILGDRVHFLGLIEDVPGLLGRSEFLVMPSIFQEPLGNVVMEAKLAGRATICFPNGGIPETVQHNVDGLVCETSTSEDLADAICKYLGDPELPRKHGIAARQSLESFGISEFGVRWQRVYARAGEKKIDVIR